MNILILLAVVVNLAFSFLIMRLLLGHIKSFKEWKGDGEITTMPDTHVIETGLPAGSEIEYIDTKSSNGVSDKIGLGVGKFIIFVNTPWCKQCRIFLSSANDVRMHVDSMGIKPIFLIHTEDIGEGNELIDEYLRNDFTSRIIGDSEFSRLGFSGTPSYCLVFDGKVVQCGFSDKDAIMRMRVS